MTAAFRFSVVPFGFLKSTGMPFLMSSCFCLFIWIRDSALLWDVNIFFCLRGVLFGHPVVVLEECLSKIAGEDYLMVVFASKCAVFSEGFFVVCKICSAIRVVLGCQMRLVVRGCFRSIRSSFLYELLFCFMRD